MRKKHKMEVDAVLALHVARQLEQQPICPVCEQPFTVEDMDTARVLNDDDDTLVHEGCYPGNLLPGWGDS